MAGEAGNDGHSEAMNCDCGNCLSCKRRVAQSHRIPKDESGKRYGKLTVVRRSEANRHCWLTKCSCGGFREVDGRELRADRATACKPCAKENQRAIVKVKGAHRGTWGDVAA